MTKQYQYIKDYEENKKGKIIEYDKEIYHTRIHPLLMRGILKVIGKNITKEVEKNDTKKSIDFDLNNDGVFDGKDATIAAKTLAKRRYDKKVK